MAPIELIRKLIPTRVRIWAYVMIITVVGWTKFLLYPYLFLLHGKVMRGVMILDGKPLYYYKGIRIESPKDSMEAYVEVFGDNVYDRKDTPRLGDTVVDIGAYVGMYTIKAAGFVGSGGLVVAVEPLPDNLAYLEKNVSPVPNIKVARMALSDYTGVGKLYHSPSTAAHSMAYVRDNYTEVSVTTLDKMVANMGITKVDYIKMDAEGSDMAVLRGAKNTLQRDFPVLSMACYHTDGNGIPYASTVAAFLVELGYECIMDKGYIYAKKKKENT
jgi:FkbM family methyltransferase